MLKFGTPDGEISCDIRRLVVAGWTGRNSDAVEHHIEELAAIGVPRPSSVPLFYEVSASLATQTDRIDVLGTETSGEAEPLLIRTAGRLWLGLASDHTDRWLETTSVAHSKQVCPKVLSCELWPYDDVADRLDEMSLCSWIDGDTIYQDGNLAMIRPLDQLLESCPLDDGDAMLCGTVPAIGGVRPAKNYRMKLGDAALGDIELGYMVQALRVVS